jgi:hypothetical protein
MTGEWGFSDQLVCAGVETLRDVLVPLVGLAGVVIGAVITRRARRDEESAAKREALRGLVGPVNVILVDAMPMRIAMNLQREESPEAIRDLRARWSGVKADLAGHAALDPDPWVRDYITRLLVATDNLLTFDAWIVSDYLNNNSWTAAKATADEHYDEAHSLLFDLARHVRGDEPPTKKP